jgi:hypothetical protein
VHALNPDNRRSLRHRLLATAAILLILAIAVGATTAAFTASTSNSNNSVVTGTVAIGDNDANGAVLALSNARPGDSDTGCIKVTFTGSLSSSVRVYATTTGSLAPYLDLKITRGTTSDPFRTCTNFVADATNYIGQGNGVVYSGTLQAFGSSYATGLVDPLAATPESWATSEVHAYKLQATLQSSAPTAAQGLSASSTFTWEARNE